MTNPPTIRTGKLSDFRPTLRNPNAHTKRGLEQLEDSMAEDGYVAPMTVAADGESLDGSARMEVAFDKFGDDAIVLEHDGTRPVVMVRTDVPDATTRQAKRIITRANQVAAVDLAWDVDVMAGWQAEDETIFDGIFFDDELGKLGVEIDLDLSDDDDDAGPQLSRYDVPDALFPSDNVWGVPTLLPDLQSTNVDLPVSLWGAMGRKKRMRGTWLFYCDDYRFTALWADPSGVVNTQCANAVEPNFTIGPQTPRALALWQIYRKRWIARWWQDYGIRVFVDMNVDTQTFADIMLLGVPKGWKAYATRGYSKRMEFTLAEYELAKAHAGCEPLFLLYGGGAVCQELARERGWVYVSEHMDLKAGGVVEGVTEDSDG